jgi:hypothetical protein
MSNLYREPGIYDMLPTKLASFGQAVSEKIFLGIDQSL